jgi:hypothetical protein
VPTGTQDYCPFGHSFNAAGNYCGVTFLHECGRLIECLDLFMRRFLLGLQNASPITFPVL